MSTWAPRARGTRAQVSCSARCCRCTFTQRGPRGGHSQAQHVDPAVHEAHGRRVGATEGACIAAVGVPHRVQPAAHRAAHPALTPPIDLAPLRALRRLARHSPNTARAHLSDLTRGLARAGCEQRAARLARVHAPLLRGSGAPPAALREAELAVRSQGVERVDLLQGKTLLKGLVRVRAHASGVVLCGPLNLQWIRVENWVFITYCFQAITVTEAKD
ncbi:hypothetical protein GGX14DRAFT_403346 [Mycena pura]|uniref:Uncharacterized protein n=1 Tax=Mycena pura TaxID=153505 RepID=A0AAD6Y4M4_9AGAR|nr:hypothetical protein GGX14DRAFT_403346 [Mycena pura]